jgi:transcriptional regulator with XRE-family HTH domain
MKRQVSQQTKERQMKKQAGLQLRPWLVPRLRASDLAREAGVSRQYVSSVVNGRKPPSDKLLEAAGRLGLPIDVIYRERD